MALMCGILVQVALAGAGRRTYTYRVPEPLAERTLPGCRVVVPVGRSRAVGFVVARSGESGAGPGGGHGDLDVPRGKGPAALRSVLRDVIEAPDTFPVLTPEILALTRWASGYYLCSWGEMILAAVPGSLLGPRRAVSVRITAEGRREVESLLPVAAGVRERLLRALSAAKGPLSRSVLLRRGGRGAGAVLDRLASSGLVEILERASAGQGGAAPRRSRGRASSARAGDISPGVPHERTSEQQACVAAITAAFEEKAPTPFLLQGVTGSGKTEVYLGAVAECLDRGKGAIYMVPEIGLTPLLGRLIRSRFGDRVAVLHSGLSAGERRREWERLRSGEARVVLGPRSSVFAPLPRLGLVVVDEEQDASYKQTDSPRYNGRDLGLVRAQEAGAVAVLGSATPSLESWQRARTGKYRLLSLPSRIGGRPLPRVQVVDLREEFKRTGEIPVISERLAQALRERVDRAEQAVVLINRRGWAPIILCRSCGETVGCRRCSVSMVLHRAEGWLRCHCCGSRKKPPVLCPSCLSEYLEPVGFGSERAEAELRRELPEARIARMDSDTVRGRSAHERILLAFERGAYDVLMGTQMVAKGHDFPGVTLVGVLLTDSTLGLPDFRAAERTWQLLTQVAGRAGRGETPGEVIVQTARPDHYAVASAITQDARAFYEVELRARRALRYPPFTVLAQVLARSRKLERASEMARRVAEAVRRFGAGRVQVLGPAPAPIARRRGEYRIQVLARAASRKRLIGALGAMLDRAEEEGFARSLIVDVDPVSLL